MDRELMPPPAIIPPFKGMLSCGWHCSSHIHDDENGKDFCDSLMGDKCTVFSIYYCQELQVEYGCPCCGEWQIYDFDYFKEHHAHHIKYDSKFEPIPW
jgi:hypothetical protein